MNNYVIYSGRGNRTRNKYSLDKFQTHFNQKKYAT